MDDVGGALGVPCPNVPDVGADRPPIVGARFNSTIERDIPRRKGWRIVPVAGVGAGTALVCDSEEVAAGGRSTLTVDAVVVECGGRRDAGAGAGVEVGSGSGAGTVTGGGGGVGVVVAVVVVVVACNPAGDVRSVVVPPSREGVGARNNAVETADPRRD